MSQKKDIRRNFKNDAIAFIIRISIADDTEEGKAAYNIMKKYRLQMSAKDRMRLTKEYFRP